MLPRPVEKPNSAVDLLNVSLMAAKREDYGVKAVHAPADASYLQIAELKRQHASALQTACNAVLSQLQAEYTKALETLDDSAHEIAAFLQAAEPGARTSAPGDEPSSWPVGSRRC